MVLFLIICCKSPILFRDFSLKTTTVIDLQRDFTGVLHPNINSTTFSPKGIIAFLGAISCRNVACSGIRLSADIPIPCPRMWTECSFPNHGTWGHSSSMHSDRRCKVRWWWLLERIGDRKIWGGDAWFSSFMNKPQFSAFCYYSNHSSVTPAVKYFPNQDCILIEKHCRFLYEILWQQQSLCVGGKRALEFL